MSDIAGFMMCDRRLGETGEVGIRRRLSLGVVCMLPSEELDH